MLYKIYITIVISLLPCFHALASKWEGSVQMPDKILHGEKFSLNTPSDVSVQQFEFGISCGKGGPEWMLEVSPSDGSTSLGIIVTSKDKAKFDATSEMKIYLDLCMGDSLIDRYDVTKQVTLTTSPNFIRLGFDGESLRIELGNKTLKKVDLISFGGYAESVTLSSEEPVTIHYCHALYKPMADIDFVEGITDDFDEEKMLEKITGHNDYKCGKWKYLDSETDMEYAMPGGAYQLMTVPTANGYDIVYLKGAKVNGSNWKPGDIKGRLVECGLGNNYDLEWYDSERKKVEDESNATFEGRMLILEFPLHRSRLRFVKI